MPAVVSTTTVAVTDGTARDRGKAWLEWRGPTGSGRLVLRGSRITIGRLGDCKLILEDGQVSRHHATLFFRGGRWHLRDEGSANGTRVNGERIQSSVLNDGDVIRMGSCTLFFHQGEAVEAEVDVTILPVSQSRPEPIERRQLPPGHFRRPEEISGDTALRREYERLHAAFSFNTYLGRETDQHKLLTNILKFGFDMVPAERGAVLVRDSEGTALMPALALDRSGERTHMLIPESILKLALDSDQAIITADAVADTRFARAPSVIGQGLRSVICVPLPGKRETVGALYFDTRAGGAFDSNHLQMLCAIAGQAAAALEQARMARQLQREQLNRHRLSRFLPRQLVQQVLREGLDLEKGGRKCRVAVLFCDIRGFCRLAERLEAFKLVRLLNLFLERMADEVFRRDGMLDKFIGDALMAVWGVPFEHDNDAWNALQAGLGMLARLDSINEQAVELGLPGLSAGIGIHYGEAVFGAVGSRQRMELTVLGDTVNLASRICQQAQGGQLLASAEVVARASQAGKIKTRRLSATRLRGISRTVHLYEVEG